MFSVFCLMCSVSCFIFRVQILRNIAFCRGISFQCLSPSQALIPTFVSTRAGACAPGALSMIRCCQTKWDGRQQCKQRLVTFSPPIWCDNVRLLCLKPLFHHMIPFLGEVIVATTTENSVPTSNVSTVSMLLAALERVTSRRHLDETAKADVPP